MSERPILFGGWGVRRILEGEKTQARRVVKPQPPHGLENALDLPPAYRDGTEAGWLKHGPGWYWRAQTAVDKARWRSVGKSAECPYGQPGDTLWVREAFRLPVIYDHMSPSEYIENVGIPSQSTGGRAVQYDADGSDNIRFRHPDGDTVEWGRKRPSIHMPRELCRLRVENVWVERVQEIDTEGVIAEGISAEQLRQMYSDRGRAVNARSDENIRLHQWRKAFSWLWNDIHGGGAWKENPWVWVITFSRITDQ